MNTIEKLTPVLDPDVKITTAVKKTVRLSVPQEGMTYNYSSVIKVQTALYFKLHCKSLKPRNQRNGCRFNRVTYNIHYIHSLSVTAWLPRLDALNELNACEEEEKNLEEECVVHNDEMEPFFRYSTSSHGHNAGPSYRHTPPSKDGL